MTKPTRILFVGDIALGGDYAVHYCRSGVECTSSFTEVRPLFDQTDLRVGNLESPLYLSATAGTKKNSLYAPPEAVRVLDYLGFTSLNLANNHITDQGSEGLSKTRALLKSHGIDCFGAGEDLATASQPAFARHEELEFAFLGYAMAGADVGAVIANELEYGCAPFSIDNIERDVATIHSRVSHVIVSLHWGYQYDRLPSPEQVGIAHRIIDAGALIVYGHHPHVVQGIEHYLHGLILYSLGNFFFPDFRRTDGVKYRFPASSRQTAAIVCEVDKSGVRSHLTYPLRVNSSYHVRRLFGRQSIRAQGAIKFRSGILMADDYERHWIEHHTKTRRFREQQEHMIGIRSRLQRFWNLIRVGIDVSILKRLHGLNLGKLLHGLRRHVNTLLILLTRR